MTVIIDNAKYLEVTRGFPKKILTCPVLAKFNRMYLQLDTHLPQTGRALEPLPNPNVDPS